MNNQSFGCLESPRDLRDYRLVSGVSNLPETFELPKPSVKNQGTVNSCAAHALSELLEKYNNVFSTGWIYGYRPEGYYQGQGMFPREALKTLQQLGAVTQADFPVNVEMSEAKDLVDKNIDILSNQAQSFKIQSYLRLYTVNEIKEWIYKGIPVPFSIKVNSIKLDDKNIIQLDSQGDSGHMMLAYRME